MRYESRRWMVAAIQVMAGEEGKDAREAGKHLVRRSTLLLAVAIWIAAFVAAPAARASTSCGYSAFEQPFLNWNDSGYYVLAKSGSFEKGASGWGLTGGAAVQSPGNPLRSTSSKYALSLPAGSSATSPQICVETGYPYSRMFAYTSVRNSAYSASLKVELLYTDAGTGKSVTQQVTTLANEPSWDATARISLASPDNIKPDSNGRLWVRYRFTPLYQTAWMIDDLYVDPKRH
jgi:hypothetical protein